MAVYSGSDGTLRWKKDSLQYSGPCILHNDLIITNANSNKESAGAFRIDNGEPSLIANPLTGELQPWTISRTYGCNSIIASENLLTFRSGAAGFYDLLTHSGTGNLGGFKSGCTSNLVVANGVLNAPDYTRTCSCAYQNQTSLALVHMPDMEIWTANVAGAEVDLKSPGAPITRLGINFGAPGDRRDPDGQLWLEYPIVAGASPPLSIDVGDDVRYFHRHGSSMSARDLSWVLASGMEGTTRIQVSLRPRRESGLGTGIAVDHSSDDAEEDEKGNVDLTSSDLELVRDKEDQLIGVRFNRVNLPRNAVIGKAFIQFACDEVSKPATSLIIAAENSGNAERSSSDGHNLSSRDRTTAEVLWQPASWPVPGDIGVEQRTPDLAALIREVVRRPDWKSGNSLAFLITGTGKRTAEAFDGDQKLAPRLIVDTDEVIADTSGGNGVPYRVRLLFGAPPEAGLGRSVFDVYLQDRLVQSDVTLNPDGPPGETAATYTFDNVMISDQLQVRFIPKEGKPLISGIELRSMQAQR